jgi:hypothetical protein
VTAPAQVSPGIVPGVVASPRTGDTAGGRHAEEGASTHTPSRGGGGRARFSPQRGERRAQKGEFMTEWAMAIDLDRCTGCGPASWPAAARTTCRLRADAVERGRVTEWLRVERHLEGTFPKCGCVSSPFSACSATSPLREGVPGLGDLRDRGRTERPDPPSLPAPGLRPCLSLHRAQLQLRQPHWEGTLEQTINPDVAVRWKGIMEKCTSASSGSVA